MHEGWIAQPLPCHGAVFCQRKGTHSFPKAPAALAALIGSAVTCNQGCKALLYT